MSNKKTYSFLLKFAAAVIIFLGISYIVNSLMEKSVVIKESTIPFLQIPDNKIDSVISLLSLDGKLNLMVITKFEHVPDSIHNNSQSGDNFENIDSTGSAAENSRYLSPSIVEIPNYSNLNAITDTTFIKRYIESTLQTAETTAKNWQFIPFRLADLNGSSDSSFMQFYNYRLNFYQKIFRTKHSLMGIKIKPEHYKILDSLKNDSNHFVANYLQKLKNNIDFVYFDSKPETEILHDFQGMIITQIPVEQEFNNELVQELLESPVDIFITQQNDTEIFKLKIRSLLRANQLDEGLLNIKLRKIIKAYIWSQQKSSDKKEDQILSRQLLNQQLTEKSICLLNNPNGLLPIKYINSIPFYVVWINHKVNNTFDDFVNKYATVGSLLIKENENNWSGKLQYQQKKGIIIYVLDSLLTDTAELRQFETLKQGMRSANSIIVNFSNCQNLNYIPDSLACIQLHSTSETDYKFAAQAIFGGIALEGQLGLETNQKYRFDKKETTLKTRLKYTIPEDAGLDPEKLKQVEKIAIEGISSGAYPGCQVFVAKEGKVVIDKSFGYHTYARQISVKENDVYDLASVTKIAATTIAAMKMIGDGKMNLNDKLGKFFKNTNIDYTRIKPDTVVKIDTFYTSSIENWKTFLKQNDTLNINDSSFITTETIITKLTPSRNIFKVPLIDLLQHKSGIVPAMPVFRYMYYKAYYIKQLKEKLASIHGKTGPVFDYRSFDLPETFPDNTNLPDSLKQKIKDGFKKQHAEYFSKTYKKDSSDIKLTESLYLKNRYFDTIWRDTKQLPVFSRKVYEYSDVNIILLQLAIDSLNKKPIDEYLKKNIYKQLGLKTITYLPLRYYGKHKIVPTEIDRSWRYGLLHGYVHDPSAALLGGMAGNAGLYSNAHDLGVLFQMILNKGSYGNVNFIRPAIIDLFTKRRDDTQRGLGFDMPNRKAVVGTKASKKSFGHSGYTGTCLWVDPENEIVFVFLSNRNHPDPKNWRIVKYKIRERIHDAVYEAMIQNNKVDNQPDKMLAENIIE